MQFNELKSPEARKKVRDIGYSLSNYMRENKIGRIALLDRSARPTYLALREAWHEQTPNVPLPEIYFINPLALNPKYRCYTGNEAVNDRFSSVYGPLVADKSSPLLVFDVCMHSGKAMTPTVEALERMGFSNVKIGLAQKKDTHCNCARSIDFVALNRDCEGKCGCYPFGKDRIVCKSLLQSTIPSQISYDEEEKSRSLDIRREILGAFEEEFQFSEPIRMSL